MDNGVSERFFSSPQDSLVLNKQKLLAFYKDEIERLILKGMERNVAKNKTKIKLPHIPKEIGDFLVVELGSVLLSDDDIRKCFGRVIVKDFSPKSSTGTIATITAPISVLYLDSFLEITFGYSLATKSQPNSRLN